MMTASPGADRRDARRFDMDALHDSMDAGVLEGIAGDAPAARAVLILLESVCWHVSADQVARALPYFPDEFGVEEMRNVMARLGFSSTLSPLAGRSLEGVDLPAVMIAPDGACHALLDGPSGPIVIAAKDGTQTAVRRAPGSMLATFFATPAPAPPKSWIQALLLRMRPQMAQLLIASFAINLMPILVSLGVMSVFDSVIPTGALDTLAAIAIGLAVALGLEIGFRCEKSRLPGQLAGRLEYLISSSIYSKIMSLPVDMITASTAGQQVARVKQFETIPQAIAGPVAALALALPFALLFIVFVFMLTGYLALIVFYAALGVIAVPVIRRRNRAAQQARAAPAVDARHDARHRVESAPPQGHGGGGHVTQTPAPHCKGQCPRQAQGGFRAARS
jgi:ATP-binding cassette subfamily C protein LapB